MPDQGHGGVSSLMLTPDAFERQQDMLGHEKPNPAATSIPIRPPNNRTRCACYSMLHRAVSNGLAQNILHGFPGSFTYSVYRRAVLNWNRGVNGFGCLHPLTFMPSYSGEPRSLFGGCWGRRGLNWCRRGSCWPCQFLLSSQFSQGMIAKGQAICL